VGCRFEVACEAVGEGLSVLITNYRKIQRRLDRQINLGL
jgi:hypothetical protein